MSNLGNTIMHHPQGAHMPDTKSIFSPVQMEANGCKVVDIPAQFNNGIQPYVRSPNGYYFSLAIHHGLFYLDVRLVRDDKWDKLPHVYMSADNDWDPRVIDWEVDPQWYKKMSKLEDVGKHYANLPVDQDGNFKDLDKEPTTSKEVEEEEE